MGASTWPPIPPSVQDAPAKPWRPSIVRSLRGQDVRAVWWTMSQPSACCCLEEVGDRDLGDRQAALTSEDVLGAGDQPASSLTTTCTSEDRKATSPPVFSKMRAHDSRTGVPPGGAAATLGGHCLTCLAVRPRLVHRVHVERLEGAVEARVGFDDLVAGSAMRRMVPSAHAPVCCAARLPSRPEVTKTFRSGWLRRREIAVAARSHAVASSGAPSSGCSGRTAPARRRCSRSSARCSRPMAARSACWATTSCTRRAAAATGSTWPAGDRRFCEPRVDERSSRSTGGSAACTVWRSAAARRRADRAVRAHAVSPRAVQRAVHRHQAARGAGQGARSTIPSCCSSMSPRWASTPTCRCGCASTSRRCGGSGDDASSLTTHHMREAEEPATRSASSRPAASWPTAPPTRRSSARSGLGDVIALRLDREAGLAGRGLWRPALRRGGRLDRVHRWTTPRSVSRVAARVCHRGVEVRNLQVREPELEEVFVELAR